MKAEAQILADVEAALKTVAHIGSRSAGNLASLQQKQDLLLALLENEHTRLMVWLYPLEQDRKVSVFSGHASRTAPEVSTDDRIMIRSINDEYS